LGRFLGTMTSVEKEFKLCAHKYEEYKGLRFRDGDCALVVDVWLYRVDEDDSGLTFEEWDPSADTERRPDPGIRQRIQIGTIRPIRVDHTKFLRVAIKTHSFMIPRVRW